MDVSLHGDGGMAAPARPHPADISPAIRKVIEFIELNFSEALRLPELAEQCNLSMHRFATVFRRQVGIPPHQYLCQVRVRQAQRLLRQGLSPADAAIEVGFFDQSHLCRHFRRQYGVSPGRFAAAFRPRKAPPRPAGAHAPAPPSGTAASVM